MKNKDLVLIGFACGILFTLVFLYVTEKKANRAPATDLIAEMKGAQLTREELRKQLAAELIPVENDEYQILTRGVQQWVENQLLKKEAELMHLSVEELPAKAIWPKVMVAPEKIRRYYDDHRNELKQPFEVAQAFIFGELRRQEYERVRGEFLNGLRQKYDAKIYLKEPANFMPWLTGPAPAGTKTAAEATVAEDAPGASSGDVIAKGPSNAKVTFMEFVDFHCAYCKKAKAINDQILQKYSQDVRFVFRHFPLSPAPGQGSFLTHEASMCAHEQGKFWEFYDKVFSYPRPPQPADLDQFAQDLGLNASQYQDCMKTGKYRDAIRQDQADGMKRGVQGTPTVFVNDQVIGGAAPFEHVSAVIESALNPGKVPPPTPPDRFRQPPQMPEQPRIATFEKNDLKDRPFRGKKDAPVTLVAFSDFHCPFCKRVLDTQKQLLANYDGKIKWVFRHYPLPFHAGADRTHEASECAAEQDKFWEYHDKLFETLGSPRNDEALTGYAKQIGLNEKKFKKCLETGKYRNLIQTELQKGQQAGVQGTPATFVNGLLISGAQPYERFAQAVDNALKETAKAADSKN